MTAKGKINASHVDQGHRIIVQVSQASGNVTASGTKTGEGVTVARVIRKSFQAGHKRAPGIYVIETSAGTFGLGGQNTMWLAPEDAAGIKRAHVEALAEDAEREATYRAAVDEDFRTSGALDDAHGEALVEAANRAQEDRFAARHPWMLIQEGVDRDHAEAMLINTQREASQSPRTVVPAAGLEPRPETHGSTVVRLLERVWARIRHDHPELPEVVIVTGSGLVGASKWGHFRADGWKLREEGSATAVRKHEMFIAGETMAKGASQVLQTMLHEGAHTLARVRGEQDTSRQGRWHNKTFLKMAEKMGLEYKHSQADKTHGYASVTLSGAIEVLYADLLEELDREIHLMCDLPVWLGGDQETDQQGGEKIAGKPAGAAGGDSKTTSGNLKATCGCQEPHIIRLSRKVLDLKIVRCDVCEDLFTADEQ